MSFFTFATNPDSVSYISKIRGYLFKNENSTTSRAWHKRGLFACFYVLIVIFTFVGAIIGRWFHVKSLEWFSLR